MSDTQTALKSKPSVDERGERLYPGLSSRNYWVLSQLRMCYVEVIAKHLNLCDSHKLVDYGCGNMPYRPLFPGAIYIGADFPGNDLADLMILEDGTLELEDESCDIVLSSQVLEHVQNVDLYLAEARRVLTQDGLLLLSTHGMWKYHPDPCDFWRWTCAGLKHVVTESGFEIIHFQGVLGPEATALQLWQDAVAPRVPGSVRGMFYRYAQWRIRRADQRCTDTIRDKDACVYIVVAKKQ